MLAVKYRIHKWNKNNSSAWAGSWSGSTCGGLHAGCGALAAAGMCVFLEADCPRSSTSGLSNKDSLSVRVTGKKRRRAAAHVCHLTSTLWSKSSQPEGPDPRIHQRYISSSCQNQDNKQTHSLKFPHNWLIFSFSHKPPSSCTISSEPDDSFTDKFKKHPRSDRSVQSQGKQRHLRTIRGAAGIVNPNRPPALCFVSRLVYLIHLDPSCFNPMT